MQLYFNDVENVTLDFSKPKEIQIVYEELFIKDIINFIHSYSIEDHGNSLLLFYYIFILKMFSIKVIKINFFSSNFYKKALAHLSISIIKVFW